MASATLFNDTLILGVDARSSFAALGYGLCTGEIDLTGLIAPNQIAGLRRAYVDAFYPGQHARFSLDEHGYPL